MTNSSNIFTILAVAILVSASICSVHAEHITPEELAIHSLRSQNVQEFSEQFKKFTKTDLTDNIFKKMIVWASAAAVTVDFAELNKAKPTMHDPHHCKDDMCFEQRAYSVGENKFGL